MTIFPQPMGTSALLRLSLNLCVAAHTNDHNRHNTIAFDELINDPRTRPPQLDLRQASKRRSRLVNQGPPIAAAIYGKRVLLRHPYRLNHLMANGSVEFSQIVERFIKKPDLPCRHSNSTLPKPSMQASVMPNSDITSAKEWLFDPLLRSSLSRDSQSNA